MRERKQQDILSVICMLHAYLVITENIYLY